MAHRRKEGWRENTGYYKPVLLEMRLRNISSIEGANRYLGEEFIEVHNKQFGKAAKDPQNGHRLLNSIRRFRKSPGHSK